MPFANFLTPLQPSVLAPSALTAHVAGGTPASSRQLNLSVQTQEQTNWCWAAVTNSVSHFYSAASPWTQCAVVNAALGRNDCCDPANGGDGTKCNQPWYLDRALNITSNLNHVETRQLSFAEVQAQIGLDAPLGTRIGWNGGTGGGHFQTIVGWLVTDSGVEYVDVSDPIYLDNQIPYSQFCSAYQGNGLWTHSYITQSAPAAVAAAGGAEMYVTADLSAIGA